MTTVEHTKTQEQIDTQQVINSVSIYLNRNILEERTHNMYKIMLKISGVDNLGTFHYYWSNCQNSLYGLL